MLYELIVIWETGEKENAIYHSEKEANEHGAGYEMAFGKQIAYWYVRKCNKPVLNLGR